MFEVVKIKDTVRVPPEKFGKQMKEALVNLTQEEYEGLIDEDLGVIVAVISAVKSGEGKVVLGDGAAYYKTDIELLVFKPEMHELVEAKVSEITEFGAFVGVGPMEGLIHVSQIMDEYLNYDSKAACFTGKESKKKIKVEDRVLARIVTISLKGTLQDSKLGLTMRQPFLGKDAWVEQEIKDTRKGKPRKTERTVKAKKPEMEKQGRGGARREGGKK
ncbi:MAG: DNA-directed RNA polymerase [Candidatus Diapherotrites archaeon]|nr:DNA-directed RNA polymerase [Candidatus Diapherotrites archaeon]